METAEGGSPWGLGEREPARETAGTQNSWVVLSDDLSVATGNRRFHAVCKVQIEADLVACVSREESSGGKTRPWLSRLKRRRLSFPCNTMTRCDLPAACCPPLAWAESWKGPEVGLFCPGPPSYARNSETTWHLNLLRISSRQHLKTPKSFLTFTFYGGFFFLNWCYNNFFFKLWHF